jgi:hypothetical protein
VLATNITPGAPPSTAFKIVMIVFSLNLLVRILASWRHTRSETSTFQWASSWGGLQMLLESVRLEGAAVTRVDGGTFTITTGSTAGAAGVADASLFAMVVAG